MNHLIRHIEYLISRCDCVVIPRLGALLAQYRPARIDPVAGIVYPPCRCFTFNSGIRDNDATIAMSISRATGMSCQKAIDYVNKEVDSMLHQLHSLGSLSLGRVGTLHYDSANGTCDFEPFATDRLSVDTAWLMPVAATPVAAFDKHAAAPAAPASRPVWVKVSRVAAAAAVLTGVWFVASTPVPLDNTSVLPASLAPDISHTAAPAVLNITSSRPETSHEADTTLVNSSAGAMGLPAPAQPEADEAPGIIDEAMVHGRFYIIVGASATADEAGRFIEMHPDLKDARIVTYGRKYVVYVSAHDTPEEATTACLETRKIYPTAWIGTN